MKKTWARSGLGITAQHPPRYKSPDSLKETERAQGGKGLAQNSVFTERKLKRVQISSAVCGVSTTQSRSRVPEGLLHPHSFDSLLRLRACPGLPDPSSLHSISICLPQSTETKLQGGTVSRGPSLQHAQSGPELSQCREKVQATQGAGGWMPGFKPTRALACLHKALQIFFKNPKQRPQTIPPSPSPSETGSSAA